MRDFLPEDIRRRQYVIDVVRRVYERYGFEPLETPALENIETLTGKYGEEGNKLIYKVLRRGEGESSGENRPRAALRPDVPLARVVADNPGKLPKFFKRYQIQPVWRADRPARGRFASSISATWTRIGSTSRSSKRDDWRRQRGAADARVQGLRRPVESPRIVDGNARRGRRGSRAAWVMRLIAIDKLDKIDATRWARTSWRAASIARPPISACARSKITTRSTTWSADPMTGRRRAGTWRQS